MTAQTPNPLLPLHLAAQAETQPYEKLEIVSTFGQPQAEYAAVHKGAAMMDLPQRGILQVGGRDRLAFLNNLLSNQTWDKATKSGLAPGSGVYAFCLNVKGRIVADISVLERGEMAWLEMDVRLVETIRTVLDRHLFSEQVTLASKVGELHRLAIHGPEASALLFEATGQHLHELAPMGSTAVKILDINAVVFRDDACGVTGYQIIVPLKDAEAVWQRLLERYGQESPPGHRRLRPVGWAAFNACRIEAGTPLFDIDFGNSADPEQSTLPAETGHWLSRAVSLTKGCYLGQEIVARMHARQQLARQLVGLRIEGGALPIAGASLYDTEQNQVGMITSSTISPVLSNAAIALGYVKRPLFAPGTRLVAPAEGSMREATVVNLPFVPPSA